MRRGGITSAAVGPVAKPRTKRPQRPAAAAEQPLDPPVRKTFWRDDDGRTRMAETASVSLDTGAPCPVCPASWIETPRVASVDFMRRVFTCDRNGGTQHPTPTRIVRQHVNRGRTMLILDCLGRELERIDGVLLKRQAS